MFLANCILRQFARNVKSCFLGNIKTITNLSSAELAKRVVMVKRTAWIEPSNVSYLKV